MKAVVVEGPHAVSYREVQAPAVGADDVLVQSREAGLCRTDIEMMTGVFTDPRWVRFPVIPGHEWAGTVVEVGADVESVDVGDRVVCEGFIVCHRCRRCRSGETQWCERIEALGFTRPGGYAELVAVPERVVHRLPEHVSFDAGVLVEPASVVLRGLEKARPAAGRGGRRDRRRHARRAGDRAAARCTRRRGSSPTACARRSSSSRGGSAPPRSSSRATGRRREAELDLVVETAGAPVAVTLATQLCRPGGRAVLLGIAGEGRTLTLPSDLLVEQGHGPDRQHRVPGVDLVARRRAGLPTACSTSTRS